MYHDLDLNSHFEADHRDNSHFLTTDIQEEVLPAGFKARQPLFAKEGNIRLANHDIQTLATDDFLGQGTLDAWSQFASTRENHDASRHFGEPTELCDQTHMSHVDVTHGSHFLLK